MDDRSIAWMISGGIRSDTRDGALQRRQRLDLALARPPRHDTLTRILRRSRPADVATIDVSRSTLDGMTVACCAA